jgi:hypothetical protein
MDCASTQFDITEGAMPEINIFPNTAGEWLKVLIPAFNQFTCIRITDLRGKSILEQKIIQPETEINLNKINAGFYFLIVYSDKL